MNDTRLQQIVSLVEDAQRVVAEMIDETNRDEPLLDRVLVEIRTHLSVAVYAAKQLQECEPPDLRPVWPFEVGGPE